MHRDTGADSFGGTNMRYFRFTNWRQYQHYTDRNPPWIKLYVDIIDPDSDRSWAKLDDRRGGQLAKLLAYAARMDNIMHYDNDLIAQDIGASSPLDLADFKELIEIHATRASCVASDNASKDASNRASKNAMLRDQRSEIRDHKTDSDKPNSVVEKVLAHLNEKAGKKFATSGGRSESSAKLVADRLRQGFTEEELIAVIDLKASQWLGGEFAKYLRPATLFNKTKFEQYVGEIGAKNSIEIRAAAAKAEEDKRKAEEKPAQDTPTWVSTDQAIADGLIPPSQFALEHAQYERRMAKLKATNAGGMP